MIGEIQISMSNYGTFIQTAGYKTVHIKGNKPEDIAEAVSKYIKQYDERRKLK